MAGFVFRLGDRDSAIATLKACLNRAAAPTPPLDDQPVFDATTQLAVTQFQQSRGLTADGEAGPATFARLAEALSYAPVTTTTTAPAWLRNLLRNDPRSTAPRQIDTGTALDLYAFLFRTDGPLDANQRDGLTFLCTSIAADAAVTDVRWAAYMLATVKHECANTWRPIEEYGKGASRPYGAAVTVTDPTTGTAYTNAYYGRGYVQLTWKDNYAEIGRQLKLGNDLVYHPEKVLDRDIAYRIMSHGMRVGSFTGRKLSDYIGSTQCDYKNARRIINGLDAWERIQGFADRFQSMLLASVS